MGRAERVRGTAGVAPRSWLVDPFAPTTRLRGWAGEAWTAWVVGGQSRDPYIAWLPELAELSPPIQWGLIVPRRAVAPPLPGRPSSLEGVPSNAGPSLATRDELAPVRARANGSAGPDRGHGEHCGARDHGGGRRRVSPACRHQRHPPLERDAATVVRSPWPG
jgi:hypothetical protein